MKFGLPMMDDNSVRRVLTAVAPTLKRNFIIPELKSNLVAEDRKETLARFGSNDFKRTAHVVMGEPDASYKAKVQSLLLADKQAKADAEKKKKAQEEERKKQLAEKKKKAEEAKKAKELAQKKKEGKDVEEEAKEEAKEDKEEETKMDEDAPPVELTDEEKKVLYRTSDTPDLAERVLAKYYASFTLPAKEEGFDSISFDWQKESECAELLKSWILEKKLTQRVDDLQPGEWFKSEWSKWTKQIQDWRKRQTEWKDPTKRKALLAKKKEDAKKKTEGEEGEEKPAEEEEAKPMEINTEDLDVFSVEDVMDLGNGEPLFSNFVYEDWALLSARFELHLLLHAFKKDLNDPDRPSFGEKHLAFYYNKYFKKPFSLKTYRVEKLSEFVDIIKSTISINEKTTFLQPEVPEDTGYGDFVKVVEDHRRERQRRIDAGDETAQLKFTRPVPQQPPRQPASAPPSRGQPAQASRYGSSGSSRPGYNGSSSGGSSYSAQKRPYSAQTSSYSASKQPRTSYGSYSGGGSSYYSRR
jgi:chemotaxis protein histidine kinase CheA